MNKKFLVTSIILAIAANCAIIGCNRKSTEQSNENVTDSANASTSVQGDTSAAMPANMPPGAEHLLPKDSSAKPGPNPYEKADIEIKTFKVDPPSTGYGYDILINKKPYLHQYNIPAMPGNNGFSTEANARKAAQFVVYKIRHNIMPPSVDPKELDSLGVLK